MASFNHLISCYAVKPVGLELKLLSETGLSGSVGTSGSCTINDAVAMKIYMICSSAKFVTNVIQNRQSAQIQPPRGSKLNR